MPPSYAVAAFAAVLAMRPIEHATPIADPTNAAAPTAPLDYRSDFDGYQRFEAQKPAPWRSSNREVGAPLRDREAPAAAVPATPTPADRSVETAPAGGHAGHKK